MTLYLPCRERPERFELNPRAPLANGLVFAGLGALPGTTHYHDSSLHGNDGELTNMTPSDDWVWIDELGRRGLDFDYIDDYVHCGSNVGLFSRTAVTHVAWVRQSRAIAYNRITCCGRSASTAPYLTFGLRSNTTYTVPGSPGGTYNEYNTGVSVASYLDEWVSFAATYDSQQVIAYLNGSVIGPGSGAWTGALGDLSAVSRYAAIGRDTYSARYFEGQIADPLIYNRALTLPEIQALADPSNAMLSGLLLPPRRVWWPVSGGGGGATTYYVRQDGSAANKAAATGPATSASACMSAATFNGETFADGDTVVFSSRGGDITTALTLPSGGSSGSPITYTGEDGYEATVDAPSGGCIVCNQSYVAINNMTVRDTAYGLHFASGTLTGITTSGVNVIDCGSEGVRHETTVTVTHDDLTITGTDEPITTHDGGTITITNSSISDYTSSGALRGAPGNTANVVVSDTTFEAATGGLLTTSSSFHGTMSLTGCIVKDKGAGRGWDRRGHGVTTLKNCIIIGATNGDYYILPASNSKIYNCTFIGNGYDPSADLIFNNSLSGFVVKNCIFKDVNDAAFTTTGTWDYNCFHNAGTTRGTNAVESDPDVSSTGRLNSGSPCIDEGVGPSTDAEVPASDIDGTTRSGSTCDIGAAEYVSTGSAILQMMTINQFGGGLLL